MSLPAWTNHWIGRPFVPLGRSPDGYDCWGLVRAVLATEFGIVLPSYGGDYTRALDRAEIANLIRGSLEPWSWVSVCGACCGDVALFRVGGEPFHVGLVLNGEQMLHTRQGVASCVEDFRGRLWGPRCMGIYRHRSLTGQDHG